MEELKYTQHSKNEQKQAIDEARCHLHRGDGFYRLACGGSVLYCHGGHDVYYDRGGGFFYPLWVQGDCEE